MAQAHEHTPNNNPAVSHHARAAVNWPFAATTADEATATESKGTWIEIHGSTYLAFCQAWAPVWIDPDDEDSLAV
jgi:hypothetical protein